MPEYETVTLDALRDGDQLRVTLDATVAHVNGPAVFVDLQFPSGVQYTFDPKDLRTAEFQRELPPPTPPNGLRVGLRLRHKNGSTWLLVGKYGNPDTRAITGMIDLELGVLYNWGPEWVERFGNPRYYTPIPDFG